MFINVALVAFQIWKNVTFLCDVMLQDGNVVVSSEQSHKTPL